MGPQLGGAAYLAPRYVATLHPKYLLSGRGLSESVGKLVKFRRTNMETSAYTYSQVQELVRKLPVKKLPVAYQLLADLSVSDASSLSLQEDFMLLPIAKRRRLMAAQAKQMVAHYERTASERLAWQAGDFVEY